MLTRCHGSLSNAAILESVVLPATTRHTASRSVVEKYNNLLEFKKRLERVNSLLSDGEARLGCSRKGA